MPPIKEDSDIPGMKTLRETARAAGQSISQSVEETETVCAKGTEAEFLPCIQKIVFEAEDKTDPLNRRKANAKICSS